VVCEAGIVAGGVVGGCGVVVGGGGFVGGVECGVGRHCGGGSVGGVFGMGVGDVGITCTVIDGSVVGVVLAVSDSRLLSKALTVLTPAFCLTIYYFRLSTLSHSGFSRPSYHLYQLVVACNVLPCGILPVYYGIPSLIGRYCIVIYLYVSG
jgi:hypothetical protein